MRFHTIIFIAVTAMLTACSRGPAKVSVINRSGVTISNVCVSGPHFTVLLGTLTPNTQIDGVVQPRRGESHAWLRYEANGQKIDSGGKDFFEVGRRPVLVVIGADLKMTSPSGIKSQ
jgi:hypothetical protein